jgi:hypothetical protein
LFSGDVVALDNATRGTFGDSFRGDLVFCALRFGDRVRSSLSYGIAPLFGDPGGLFVRRSLDNRGTSGRFAATCDYDYGDEDTTSRD